MPPSRAAAFFENHAFSFESEKIKDSGSWFMSIKISWFMGHEGKKIRHRAPPPYRGATRSGCGVACLALGDYGISSLV